MVKAGGTMKRMHLLLMGSAIAFAVHCASTDSGNPAGGHPAAVGLAESSASSTLTAIRSESGPTPRIVLQTNGSPAYTSYSPDPVVFVVDLPHAARGEFLTIPEQLPRGVNSIVAEEAIELGAPLVRVAIRHAVGMSAKTRIGVDGIEIEFEGVPTTVASMDFLPEPMPEPMTLEPEKTDSMIAVETVPIIADAALESTPDSSKKLSAEFGSASTPPATRLEKIRTRGAGQSLELTLEADGAIQYSAFRLGNPERIVFDLAGISNGVAAKQIPLGDPYVRSVRVSQFATSPQAVTRVVLDLDEAVEYRVERRSGALAILFDRKSVAEVPISPVVSASAQPVKEDVFSAPPKPAETKLARVDPVVPALVPSDVTHVIHSPSAQSAPRRPSTTTLTPSTSGSTEDVFIEPPVQQRPGSTLTGTISAGTSRTLSQTEKVYTGEPIDLTLKEADIKDVLRLFAQLTGLNIAIDPQVTGSVTVDFQGVPWDQALELILRQNGLAYEIEGNVMRIGTLARLTAEQAQERKLAEDRSLNVPLTTVSHKLSYAKAATVEALIKSMASPRAKIIQDDRTNQLIITEIPQYLQTMLNLIETIDIPTPQVVIEARIVETTKNFSQQFGVEWGFNGTLDPAFGSGTGLQFPSSVAAVGGPFNFASGNPVLDLTLSNILGTFNLDFLLTAAESEGLVRIVSAPKVTTQDNESATIESGVQIPVQTRVNFTTTVTYVNATLKLTVTPQITAQDTVILMIDVQKIEPALGLQVVGGAGTALLTRKATTKLMVRDGGTTVIGGIYQATENRAQTRMPFLHSIPVLGNLFKNKTFDSRHDELIIFITPRIVRTP